jgi:hypothetical protein
VSVFDAQNVKLAMGAGKGGAISAAAIWRSGVATTTAFRVGRSGTGFLLGEPSAGFGGCFAGVRFTSARLSWRSFADLPPVLRPVFRSGRAFAIERSTLLGTPGAVNSVSAP